MFGHAACVLCVCVSYQWFKVKKKKKETLWKKCNIFNFFQGEPGFLGPQGEPGLPGLPGTKVGDSSLQSSCLSQHERYFLISVTLYV